MVACPRCGEDEELTLAKELGGTARIIRCGRCGHEWQRGGPPVAPEPGRTTSERLRAKFPTAGDVTGGRLKGLDGLASQFDGSMPHDEAEFRTHYRKAFAKEALKELTAEQFQHFYRSSKIAGLGYGGWAPDYYFNSMDPEEYMVGVRGGIEYLLHSEKGTLESRLTDLIEGRGRVSVLGIKETVLTKVLAVAMPDRVFPFATYDAPGGGKRQIARKVLGLDLPERDRADWTIGRLIIWSSDLFAELTRRWWDELWVGASFLWSLWQQSDDELEMALSEDNQVSG